ncbi:MAG: cation:dicarboxylase symporter family transporter [Pseudomonadota bacterium]
MRHRFLPLWVLIGAVVGVIIGIFSPKIATVIDPVGDVYIRLMEVVVLPYLIASLMLGLGQLTPSTAKRLLQHSWIAYIFLWVSAFAIILVAAATAPTVARTPVVNFTSQPEGIQPLKSLVDLVIPDNLFAALAQNYVPSIVVVAIIFGIALQFVEEKNAVLGLLRALQKACVTIWNWVVFLAPVGVCALLAGTINNANFSELLALSIYMAVVTSAALLLAFLVFPMLLAALTPVGYWEILSALKNAFLIAFVTTLSVAALPMIQAAVDKLAQKDVGSQDPIERREIVQTTLSVSYPLAQVGNFFILAFLLYASFYFFVPIQGPQLFALPGMTLISGIGSPSSSIGAVSFLSGWLGLPSLATDLYVETMTVTRYAQVLASVSAFAFVTILVTFNFYGRLQFRPRRFIAMLIVSAGCAAGIGSLGQLGGESIPLHSETNYRTMGLPSSIQTLSDANISDRIGLERDANTRIPSRSGSQTGLSGIQSEGKIRIGFNPKVLPFTYINSEGRLVGYDVELIYRFAWDMNVELEFIPYNWETLQDDLKASKFDLAIGGLYITEERLEDLTASNPYYENPLALIVRHEQVDDYASRDQINGIENLTIAVFDDPVLLPLAKRSFPKATIKVVPNYDKLSSMHEVDAAIWTLEQARAYAVSNTGYAAVVPKDMATRFLFGYLMSQDSLLLVDYLNFWLNIQKSNGTLEDMEKRWIDPAIDQSSQSTPAGTL